MTQHPLLRIQRIVAYVTQTYTYTCTVYVNKKSPYSTVITVVQQ